MQIEFDVVQTTRVKLDIKNDAITGAALDEFNATMFEATMDQYLAHIAEQCLRYPSFIEGVGSASTLSIGATVQYDVEVLETDVTEVK